MTKLAKLIIGALMPNNKAVKARSVIKNDLLIKG